MRLSAENMNELMDRALELARQGEGRVHPNPLVGALIVRPGTDGSYEVVGTGYHHACGTPHAEVLAVADAKKNGCTDFSDTVLIVTLEPCCHTGRTPPCTSLILAEKIGAVVCGMIDPNEKVAGKGVALLRAHGVEVVCGVREESCRRLNRVFCTYIAKHRPYVCMKAAVSLDGKTALQTGESRWISCPESRLEVHKLRSLYTGVMCGIGTVLADDPELSVRLPAPQKSHHEEADTQSALIGTAAADAATGTDAMAATGTNTNTDAVQPVRIVADSRLRIPEDSVLVQTAGRQKTIVLCAESALQTAAGKEKQRRLAHAAVDVIAVPAAKTGGIDLAAAMTELAQRGIDSILLEGGGTLADAMIRARLVDLVRFYIAPVILGGKNSKTAVSGAGVACLAEAACLKQVESRRCGCDIVLEGELCLPD